MPSEVIYGSGGDVDIRVSWGSDESQTVQVVTQAAKRPDKDPTERLIGIVNSWLEDAKMPQIDLAELREKLPFEPSFDGWWALLSNWGECNRMIKVLQRARDRAFGSPA